jgi:hypothetical protein
MLSASGKDNLGQTFSRITKGAFNVAEVRDQSGALGDKDLDGMPDVYEQIHPCLDPNVKDETLDPDLDELSNLEEYKAGTDPCDPDTDGGGESDSSEIARSSNPFNPADDALPRPIDVNVIDKLADHVRPQPDLQPNANLIRYPVNPAYTSIRLLRSTSPGGPFAEVAVFDAAAKGGLYQDMGLTNGVTYYYRLQGINLNGAKSAPSHVFSGTPHSDPFPPIGSIEIEGGAPYVASHLVTLKMHVEAVLTPVAGPNGGASNGPQAPEATDMMISNDPSFAGASWQSFVPTTTWTLSPNASGYALVGARFRDAAGNVSETYFDDIQTTPPSSPPISLGSIHLYVYLYIAFPLAPQAPQVSDLAGSTVRVKGYSDYPPAFTNDQGEVTLPGLLPGTYDLIIERPGFVPLIIKGVVVGGDQTVDLGQFTLAQPIVYIPLIRK